MYHVEAIWHAKQSAQASRLPDRSERNRGRAAGTAYLTFVRKVRRGLWRTDTTIRDARSLAMEVTRPYPSYVSFESALFAHGLIDQVPRAIALASLGRPRVARTTLATFVVHRLPPELFGGFTVDGDVRVASPEKALFDFHYVAVASGHPKRRPPEVDLSTRLSRREIRRWVDRIPDPRLRRRVEARVARSLPP